MCVEIEAKLKVDSLNEIEHRLNELHADFLTEKLQIDTYFDDVNSNLRQTDRCLRLRREITPKNESFFLTYKGAREKPPEVALNSRKGWTSPKSGFAVQFKRRQEIEIEIKDHDSTVKLLVALGFRKVLVFDKKRRTWQLGDCNVALDQLPLIGNFVEIEGPDNEKIADVQKTIGLTNLLHIVESYATLIEQKLREIGEVKREILLSNSSKRK